MIDSISGAISESQNVFRLRAGEISSGKKDVTFTSPATLQVGERLLSKAVLTSAKNSNIQNQLSFNRTKDAFIANMQRTSSRIGELSVRANSGILAPQDRKALNAEAQQLQEQLNNDFQNASFNGIKLLDDPAIQNAVNNIDNIDISTQAGADAAVQIAADSGEQLSDVRAETGAKSISLEQQYEGNRAEEANLRQAGSRLADSNIAESFMAATRSSILSQVGLAMQVQSQNIDRGILNLIA